MSKTIQLTNPPKVEYPSISERIFFQIEYENTRYLGFFTLDVCKYLYYMYSKKKRSIETYMRIFLDAFLGIKTYNIYLISKVNIYDDDKKGKGKSSDSDLQIEFDKNISVNMIFHQSKRIFHFQEFVIEEDQFDKVEKEASIWNFIDYDEDENDIQNMDDDEFRRAKCDDAFHKMYYWKNVISYLHKNKSSDPNYHKMVECCQLRRATQICRKHKYDQEEIFPNFVAVYIDAPFDVPSYFEYEDDLDFEVRVEIKSTCGKYHVSGEVCSSGSLQRGVEWDYNITPSCGFGNEKIEIDEEVLEELYKSFFQYFVSFDI